MMPSATRNRRTLPFEFPRPAFGLRPGRPQLQPIPLWGRSLTALLSHWVVGEAPAGLNGAPEKLHKQWLGWNEDPKGVPARSDAGDSCFPQ